MLNSSSVYADVSSIVSFVYYFKQYCVQIVALKTTGICNRDITKLLDACREPVCIQCMETIHNFQEVYSCSKAFDLCQTNWANGYEASEEKYSQEHEENSKSPRDHLCTWFFKRFKAYWIQNVIQVVTFMSFQAGTTWHGQNDVGGDAVPPRPCLHSGGSYQHVEWWTVCTWCREFAWRSRTHLGRMKQAGVAVRAAAASGRSKSLWSSSESVSRWTLKLASKCWQKKCLLWIPEGFGNRCVFSQNGASADTSNLTQRWYKDHFSGGLRQKHVASLKSWHQS